MSSRHKSPVLVSIAKSSVRITPPSSSRNISPPPVISSKVIFPPAVIKPSINIEPPAEIIPSKKISPSSSFCIFPPSSGTPSKKISPSSSFCIFPPAAIGVSYNTFPLPSSRRSCAMVSVSNMILLDAPIPNQAVPVGAVGNCIIGRENPETWRESSTLRCVSVI